MPQNIYNMDYNQMKSQIKRLQKIINNYSEEQWGEMISYLLKDTTEWMPRPNYIWIN